MRYLIEVNDSVNFLRTSRQEIIFISDKKDAKVALDYFREQCVDDDKYEFVEFDEKNLKIVYNVIYGEEDELITEENYLDLYPLKSAKEL